uniref:RNA transcription, translation and transport factor protein n=1 Tax=Suricata suricatta TaxID=37032 RepID=A0A673UBY8_SURSU
LFKKQQSTIMLIALNYHNPDGFNCSNEIKFRKFAVWLEDQNITHYKIKNRGNLRNIHRSDHLKCGDNAENTRT